MDPDLGLSLVGLSHRTAPVAVRERYVVAAAELTSVLRSLTAIDGVAEACVVSTCNRTEALIVAGQGAEPVARVREHLFRNLRDGELYVHHDVHALIHVFRTAAGLESVVLGETEIQGQLKRAFDAAHEAGTLGPVLSSLLNGALRAGKRVRAETELGHGTLSVARVGVDIAARVFERFDKCSALVVGAGETGLLVARHLKDRGLSRLSFANRTIERAEKAAAELGASAHGLDRLSELCLGADIVIACTEAGTVTIAGASFDARALRKRDRPLLVIDLSVPRAVAPEVARFPNVLLYDLDDLERVVRENHHGRAAAGEEAAGILVSEMHKFLASRTYASFRPAITGLKTRFEKVREEVLDLLAGAKSDPAQLELAHELSKRLLNVALEQLKEGARSARSEEALDREYQRFVDKQ